jgi:hypothetical protein
MQLPFFTDNNEEPKNQEGDDCTGAAVGYSQGHTYDSHENQKRNSTSTNSFSLPPSCKRNQSQVEADGGDAFCTKTSVHDTPITIISPFVTENQYTGHGYVHIGQLEVHMTCTLLDMTTSVLMRGYN